MNIQTERLDDHTARLTVEVEPERFSQAKQKAARKISQKVNLPGFRKGKAPYNIVVRYLGEGAILEEAVEALSDEIYAPALIESGLAPYGPGSLQDFDPAALKVEFVVPLQPEVKLGAYRDVRLAYEAPQVTDAQVERELRAMQQEQAVVEPSDQPAAAGDRVTLNIHSHVHPAGETHDEAEEADAEHDDEHGHDHEGEVFMHEHDAPFVLDAANEPLPGFADALIGAAAGETRDFELVVPEDSEDFEAHRGMTVHFEIGVNKVEHITLPALNDEFAARVTAEEEEPLTLLQLRIRAREQLSEQAQERSLGDYASKVLDQILAQAEVHYPEAAVVDQVQSMLQYMDTQLRQQGLNLEDYKKLLHKTDEDLFNDYREAAVEQLRRALVRREIFAVEGLQATEADVDAEFTRIIGNVDEEQREMYRTLFEGQGLGNAVRERISDRLVRDRIAAIGRGEAPELPEAVAEPVPEAEPAAAPETEAAPEPVDTPADVSTSDEEESA